MCLKTQYNNGPHQQINKPETLFANLYASMYAVLNKLQNVL